MSTAIAGQPILLKAALGGYSAAPAALLVSVDNGPFVPTSVSAQLLSDTAIVPLPSMAVGAHSVQIRDAANGAVSPKFTLTVNAPPAVAAPGIPSWGIGVFDYPGNTDFQSCWDDFVSEHGAGIWPTTLLCYGGDFTNFDNVVSNLTGHFRTFAAEPRLNGSMGHPPVTLVISLPSWCTNGRFTFDTIAAGQNDAQIAAIDAAAQAAGFPIRVYRFGYEDDFPTTPGGMNSDHGAFNGIGGTTAGVSVAYSVDTPAGQQLYCDKFAPAFRRFSHVVRQSAISHGGAAYTLWGATIMNGSPMDVKRTYPDQPKYMAADSYGFCVDGHGPDKYSDQYYGGAVLQNRPGYSNLPPFTYMAPTGLNAPDIVTWAKSRDNKWAYDDFIDNNGDPAASNNDWSTFKAINWAERCPGGPKWMIFPECGAINSREGNNGGLLFAPDGGSGNDVDQADWLRRTIGWAQARGVDIRTFCRWNFQSALENQSIGRAFFELRRGYSGPKTVTIAPPQRPAGYWLSARYYGDGVTTAATPAMLPGANSFSIVAQRQLDALDGKYQPIASLWDAPGANGSEVFLFAFTDDSAHPNRLWVAGKQANGTIITVAATADVPSSITSAPLWVRVTCDRTNATFATSPDSAAWTTLGAPVAFAGPWNNPSTGALYSIGAGGSFRGFIGRTVLTVNGVVASDFNPATMAENTNTPTDAQGNVFSLAGFAHVIGGVAATIAVAAAGGLSWAGNTLSWAGNTVSWG